MSSNSSINSMVIVAIPDENDRVWKVSSEKVPHLTLLFLGDADKVANPESIVQFVEHAADRSLNRFYLPVDRRDELGEAKADVLYFKKNRYDFKAVRDFRSLLLKDDNIKTAYDSTSQHEFPDHVGAAGQPWIPHLTMGYPDSPSNPMPDGWESNFYSVEFNKIAVWLGNYEGPEFLLKDYWDEMDNIDVDPGMATPLAMAARGEEFISHYGKKGMKWGVRNSERGGQATGLFEPEGKSLGGDVVKSVLWPLVPPLGLFAIPAQVRLTRGAARGVKSKAINMNEKRFIKKAHSDKNFVEIHNRSTEKFNREIGGINAKHPGDLTKSPKKQKAYDADVQKLLQNSYREAAKSIGNKPNTMHLDLQFKNDGMDFAIKAKQGAPTPLPIQVKHAAEAVDETITYEGKIKRDATGHILGLEFNDFKPQAPGSMAQNDELIREFLAHHGVKGMHWGDRKDDVTRAAESNPANAIAKVVNTTSQFVKDVQFESAVSDKESETLMDTEHEIHSKANKEFKKTDIPAIKAKPEHQQAAKLKNRLLHPFDKGTKAYRKEMREAYIKRVEETANSMTNASGTRQYTVREKGGELPSSKYYWEVTTRHIQHADGDEVTITLEVLMDKDGFITGTKPVENTVAQTMDLGAEWLAHHGVKGMKWGVRRERGTPGFFETKRAVAEAKTREKRTAITPRVQDTIGSSGRKKTTIKTKGGEDHPATPDAIRVAASTQKLQKSGVHALTNKELQEVAQRLNLETQVSVLMGKKIKKGPGKKFVEDQLKEAQKNPGKTFESGKKVAKTAGTLLKARRLAGVP